MYFRKRWATVAPFPYLFSGTSRQDRSLSGGKGTCPESQRRRSAKTGLPPGALIHIGEKHAEKAKITLCEYDESHFKEKEIQTLEGVLPPPDGRPSPGSTSTASRKSACSNRWEALFGLHPLTLEDILNTDQRPKIEDHGDYLYIVLKLFHEGRRRRS